MKRNNYKTPGKCWLTNKETKEYLDMIACVFTDPETFKLGIGLFKQSKTFKHYRKSPIDTFRDYTLERLIYAIECCCKGNRYKDKDVLLYHLKSWMIHHTISYSRVFI